jgi:hypothetical protein
VRAFIFILFSCLSFWAVAQQQDTAIITTAPAPVAHSDSIGPRKHSPRTATLLSMVLPGAGQVYNRKNWWWKVPIIYGGGVALVYGVTFYQNKYVDFRDAYAYRIQNNVKTNGDPYYDKFPDQSLFKIRNSYKEARDQCIIGLVLLYTLQVVDASVEAHFFDFNVSEDLSLNIQPQFVMNGPVNYNGVQLTFTLK